MLVFRMTYYARPPNGLKKFPNNYWKNWDNVARYLEELSEYHHAIIPGRSAFEAAGLAGMLAAIHTYWGGLAAARERFGNAGVKYCAGCNTRKQIEDFRMKSHPRGVHRDSVCTVCSQDRSREYRNNTWRGRAAELFRAAKSRAKVRGLEFNLDKKWIVDRLEAINFTCEVTGIPFALPLGDGSSGIGFANRFGASLDRIDSSRGYTKDNVRIVTNRINVALGDLTDAQFEQFAIGFLKSRGFNVTR